MIYTVYNRDPFTVFTVVMLVYNMIVMFYTVYSRDDLHSLQSCITQFTIVMFYSLQASRFTVCNIVMFYTVYSRDVSSYGGVPVKH